MIEIQNHPILVAPMPTPFTKDDKVDLKAIESNSLKRFKRLMLESY